MVTFGYTMFTKKHLTNKTQTIRTHINTCFDIHYCLIQFFDGPVNSIFHKQLIPYTDVQ